MAKHGSKNQLFGEMSPNLVDIGVCFPTSTSLTVVQTHRDVNEFGQKTVALPDGELRRKK